MITEIPASTSDLALPNVSPDLPTKERLLIAAGYIFACKGYQDATIAEISQLASANIAAVNYHFKDKHSLYAEAIHVAFEKARDKYKPNGNLPTDAPAEQRLRARITAILSSHFDNSEASYFRRIIVWEMSNPSDNFKNLIAPHLTPLKQQLHDMLADLLGPTATPRDIQLCSFSIISQCHSPLLRKHMHPAHISTESYTPDQIQYLINHVTEFSLAGIKMMRIKREQQVATTGEI
ncbi:CerR family C-terminal domain-containing protein [Poriferisphaera sp. WC338]|uniref:CerR family C-terminal domain-containing protein n=1 Tax=Poriferisphaera sp. WC338 TaxID=3425129 RepID=UPI003D813A52